METLEESIKACILFGKEAAHIALPPRTFWATTLAWNRGSKNRFARDRYHIQKYKATADTAEMVRVVIIIAEDHA